MFSAILIMGSMAASTPPPPDAKAKAALALSEDQPAQQPNAQQQRPEQIAPPQQAQQQPNRPETENRQPDQRDQRYPGQERYPGDVPQANYQQSPYQGGSCGPMGCTGSYAVYSAPVRSGCSAAYGCSGATRTVYQYESYSGYAGVSSESSGKREGLLRRIFHRRRGGCGG